MKPALTNTPVPIMMPMFTPMPDHKPSRAVAVRSPFTGRHHILCTARAWVRDDAMDLARAARAGVRLRARPGAGHGQARASQDRTRPCAHLATDEDLRCSHRGRRVWSRLLII